MLRYRNIGSCASRRVQIPVVLYQAAARGLYRCSVILLLSAFRSLLEAGIALRSLASR